MKDVSWALNSYYMAMVFGSLALAWCFPLTWFALSQVTIPGPSPPSPRTFVSI